MALGLIESYNRTRYAEELLNKVDGQPPSFTVHLHTEYWVLNNGNRFLYHNQIASLLDDIRAHRIPVDFLDLFDSAGVPFYEGCMVVELLDYRSQKANQPQPDKPERTRVVLHPNPETLYADICSMNQKSGGMWSDRDAVEVESKLLLATCPPLCLDPNPHLTRVANHVLRASTPTVPMSLKRKAAALVLEEEESERVRRAKIIAHGSPRDDNRINAPSFSILDTLFKFRKEKEAEAQQALPHPSYLHGPPPRPPLLPISPSPANGVKAEHPAASQPTQNSLQYPSQQPPTATPVQPRVYANVQASTEVVATNRTPTPQITQQQQHQHQLHQLQLIQKAEQQQQQTVQASPKVPPQIPQLPQNERSNPTPTPNPSMVPAQIQPTASSSGGPYPNQFIMQVSQQSSQQPQPGVPTTQPRVPSVQQPRVQPQQLLGMYQNQLVQVAERLKTEPHNHELAAQLKRLRLQYHNIANHLAAVQAAGGAPGRGTPQVDAGNGQSSVAPSPANATAGIPPPTGQQQQGQSNGHLPQHQAVPINPQHHPQQQAQPQQLGTGQFTFNAATGFNPASVRRAGTPTQGQMLAVAHVNQAKANAGTPVPGGVAGAQRSPQHQPSVQQQQQHAQQQLRTPQIQNQQLRTPQLPPQQLRTPQVPPQQARTPQMQQQQLQVPQLAQMQRQATPQALQQHAQQQRQQRMALAQAQAHAQAQAQAQAQAHTRGQPTIQDQQQILRMMQLQQLQQQQQQKNGQPTAQQLHMMQQQQLNAAYSRAPNANQAHTYQQWFGGHRQAQGQGQPQQQHPNAVQAQVYAAAAAAGVAGGGGANAMGMQGNMQGMQQQPNHALLDAMRQQQAHLQQRQAQMNANMPQNQQRQP